MNKQIHNAKLIIDEDTDFIVELIDTRDTDNGTFEVTVKDYTTGEETIFETDMDGFVITPSNIQRVEILDSNILPETVAVFKE